MNVDFQLNFDGYKPTESEMQPLSTYFPIFTGQKLSDITLSALMARCGLVKHTSMANLGNERSVS